jgi:hypothetical protein
MGTQMTQLTYLIAIAKLKAGESTNFLDMKSLSCVDLDKLFEDIKSWKVHRIYKFNLKPINQKKNLLSLGFQN